MTTRRTSGGSNLLPQAPAVTGVLLRQQTRRLWKPTALAQMFARLPRLKEVCLLRALERIVRCFLELNL